MEAKLQSQQDEKKRLVELEKSQMQKETIIQADIQKAALMEKKAKEIEIEQDKQEWKALKEAEDLEKKESNARL